MTNLYIVIEETDYEGEIKPWVLEAHLSRRSAMEFVKKNAVGGRQLYIATVPVVNITGETTENSFLSLQRQLSRVERRLGKARAALKLANTRLKIYQEHFNNPDAYPITYGSPVYMKDAD
jgi:hypothetical protein